MKMMEHNSCIESKLLSAIEDYWGFKLPKDYRDFVVKYNGGVPENTAFNFKNSKEGSILSDFLGIIDKGYSYNLLIVNKDVGDRYPVNMLPIAHTVGGDRILLSVKMQDRGKVYFWDHEMESEDDEEPDYSNLTLIADSFDEFINGLYSEQDIDLSEE